MVNGFCFTWTYWHLGFVSIWCSCRWPPQSIMLLKNLAFPPLPLAWRGAIKLILYLLPWYRRTRASLQWFPSLCPLDSFAQISAESGNSGKKLLSLHYREPCVPFLFINKDKLTVTFIAEELLELHSTTEFTFWWLMPRQAALDASGVAKDLCWSPVRVWYLHQAEGLSMVPDIGTVLGVPLEEVTAVSPLREGGNTAEVLAQGGEGPMWVREQSAFYKHFHTPSLQ